MRVVVTENDQPQELQFQQWALVLETSKTTDLLDIPHFGHGMKMNFKLRTWWVFLVIPQGIHRCRAHPTYHGDPHGGRGPYIIVR